MGPTLILAPSCTEWWCQGDVGLVGLSKASPCRAAQRNWALQSRSILSRLGNWGVQPASPRSPSSLIWLSDLGNSASSLSQVMPWREIPQSPWSQNLEPSGLEGTLKLS